MPPPDITFSGLLGRAERLVGVWILDRFPLLGNANVGIHISKLEMGLIAMMSRQRVPSEMLPLILEIE